MSEPGRVRRVWFWTTRVATFPVPRSLGRELLPLALPLFMFPWILVAVRNYAGASLFRDANMFSYAAFCFRHGEKMYRDFATPDGPLIYLIQAAFQIVWGVTPHDLRMADLDVETAFGAIVGVLVVPRARDWVHGAARRITWGVIGAFAWLAQMLWFDNAATLQRENYYVGIGCVALALAYGSREHRPRVAQAMLIAAGVLAGMEPFGKHSGVIYVGQVVLAAWLIESRALDRRQRLLALSTGIFAGAFAMLLLIVLDGSMSGFWFYYFRYNFLVYKFQWIGEPAAVLVAKDHQQYAVVAGLALFAGIAMMRTRAIPAAVAAFAVGPALHLAAATAQMRGWRYHYIPVEASAHAAFVAYMGIAWCAPAGEVKNAVRDVAAIAALLFFGWRIQSTLVEAAFLDKAQKLDTAADANEPYKAAEYLAEHTRSTDRVFYYGGDPVVPFVAKRLPATPYIVAWLLDFRQSLVPHGDNGSMNVTDKQRETILAMEARTRADACDKLVTSKPPALVFMDMGNMGLTGDPVATVESWCAPLRGVIEHDYHHGTTIGRNQIFLRNDRQ